MTRAYTEEEVRAIRKEAFALGGTDSFDEREDLRGQVAKLKAAVVAAADSIAELCAENAKLREGKSNA